MNEEIKITPPTDVNADPYEVWKKTPSPENLGKTLKSLQPTIDSALATYGGGNVSPILRGRARALAAAAVRSYDPSRGAALKSHVMTQLQPLGRFNNRATQPIGIPEQRMRQVASLQRAENDFYERHGRDATDAELADALGLSALRLNNIRKFAAPTIRTDASGETAVDPVTNRLDPTELWLDYIYHDLTAEEQNLMDWKLGRNGRAVMSNVEIAKRLKISPAAVSKRTSQLQRKLLAGLEAAQ